MAVVTTDEFATWYEDREKGLREDDLEAVTQAIDVLDEMGVALPFPRSSQLKGSKHPLRELRVQARGEPIRIAYAFDPARDAVLVVAAYKGGDDRFYEWFIPSAETIWERYIAENAALWPKKSGR